MSFNGATGTMPSNNVYLGSRLLATYTTDR